MQYIQRRGDVSLSRTRRFSKLPTEREGRFLRLLKSKGGVGRTTQITANTFIRESHLYVLWDLCSMHSQEEGSQPRDRRSWTEEEDEMLRAAIEEGT